MYKNFWLIGMLVIAIIVIISISIIIINNNSNENSLKKQLENNIENNDNSDLTGNEDPKYLLSLLDIPMPNSIIFYHNGVKKSYTKGTKEFNEIIKLNNKRNNVELAPLQLVVDIDYLIQNTDMLEYTYQNYNSIYFNLVKAEQLKIDNNVVSNENWVSVGYNPKVFNQFIYGGLLSADNLIAYLYSL